MNKKDHVGETKTAINGLGMTIIEYNSYSDIVVKFEDNYTCRTNYKQFKEGYVKNPNAKQFTNRYKRAKEKYIGKTTETNYGTCKIVEYNGSNNIVVEFENGDRVRTSIKSFQQGHIKPASANYDCKLTRNKESRIGAEFVNNQGYKAKIIGYIDAKHITIQFEDGTILKNKMYHLLVKGQFKKPIDSKVGERKRMNCGVIAEIIEYNSYNDITVKFDTGEIRKGISYGNFSKGVVSIIKTDELASVREGYTFRAKCGLNATIIKYDGANKVTAEFEDKTKVENIQYNAILRGQLKHPTITVRGTGALGSYKLHKRVYLGDDMVLYHCTCQKCGIENILTPQEMLKHKC